MIGPNKRCFVIMPFSKQRMEVYTYGIAPACEQSGYFPVRVDKLVGHFNINRKIIEHIFECEAVIAEITDKNPNVFYEMGVVHTIGNKTIMIAQSSQDLPFDIRNYRCIIYEQSVEGLQCLQKEIMVSLQAIEQWSQYPSNPVQDFKPHDALVSQSAFTQLHKEMQLKDELLRANKTEVDELQKRIRDTDKRLHDASVSKSDLRTLQKDVQQKNHLLLASKAKIEALEMQIRENEMRLANVSDRSELASLRSMLAKAEAQNVSLKSELQCLRTQRQPVRLPRWILRKLLDYGVPNLAFLVTLYLWKVAFDRFGSSPTNVLVNPVGLIGFIGIFWGTIFICLFMIQRRSIKYFLFFFGIPLLSFVVTLGLSKFTAILVGYSQLEFLLNPLGLVGSISVYAVIIYTMRRSGRFVASVWRLSKFLVSVLRLPESWIKWMRESRFPLIVTHSLRFAGVPGLAFVVTLFLLSVYAQFSAKSIKMILEHPLGIPISLGVFLGTVGICLFTIWLQSVQSELAQAQTEKATLKEQLQRLREQMADLKPVTSSATSPSPIQLRSEPMEKLSTDDVKENAEGKEFL